MAQGPTPVHRPPSRARLRQVYEMHARICLEFDDTAELKQCQAQLTQLYEEGLGTREGCREFMAYNILFNLGMKAANNVNDLMLQLTDEDKQIQGIDFSMFLNGAWQDPRTYMFSATYNW